MMASKANAFRGAPGSAGECSIPITGLWTPNKSINRMTEFEIERALRDAIGATKDFDGVTGRITLDANRDANKPAVVLTIKNGKYSYVTTVAP